MAANEPIAQHVGEPHWTVEFRKNIFAIIEQQKQHHADLLLFLGTSEGPPGEAVDLRPESLPKDAGHCYERSLFSGQQLIIPLPSAPSQAEIP